MLLIKWKKEYNEYLTLKTKISRPKYKSLRKYFDQIHPNHSGSLTYRVSYYKSVYILSILFFVSNKCQGSPTLITSGLTMMNHHLSPICLLLSSLIPSRLFYFAYIKGGGKAHNLVNVV
jgi:hypothetical protein